MGASLKEIIDPRGIFEKFTRKELEYLARLESREDIDPEMPAQLMRARFQNNPPARMPRPMRATLGAFRRLVVPPYDDWKRVAFNEIPPAPVAEEVEQKDALSDLEAQWSQIKTEKKQPSKEKPKKMHELKAEAKRLGIKQSNKDTKAILEQKIADEIAS